MNHLAIMPILLPLLTAVLMLLPPLGNGPLPRQRATSLLILVVMLGVAIELIRITASGEVLLYALGGWQPPFGIVLVVDRLAALMVLLSSILGLCTMLYASAGDDRGGNYFHPLFMFQLAGINGAFLTGDIFNLFVFFEILLIASYALLIHGGGKQKTRAGIHYIVLNLAGSSVFLIALGIIYGICGTLNMVDLAHKVATLSGAQLAIARIGALLLLVVFGLKAAMLPLHFWLPGTYSAASAPVAALFAILSKVGIYSIIRVFSMIFSAHGGELADIAIPWLWPLSILTLLVAIIGILAAASLRQLSAQLIILSVGTLLTALAINNQNALSGALYYLLHSTVISAALFLLADMVRRQRGKAEDRFVSARQLAQPGLLGTLFFIAAIGIIGLPPLSGAVGKALILFSADTSQQMLWIWPSVLIGSLAALIALSRAGSTMFWKVTGESAGEHQANPVRAVAVALLLLCSPLMVVAGGPLTEYLGATAAQVHDLPQQLSPYLAEVSR